MSLSDPDAFLEIMKRYEGRLIAYIKRLTSVNYADAEDILQEVFIKCYQNLNDFDSSLKFSSWIYRITHNEAISYYRKTKNAAKTFESDDAMIVFEKMSSETNLENELKQKMTKQKIQELLDELDPKYKEVIVLSFLEEKDYKEISHILKNPMGSVATLLNRAKKKFKNLLVSNYVN